MKKTIAKHTNSLPMPHRKPFFSHTHSQAFFSGATIQPKLTIGQPNDKYEQEADRVAEHVMRMPTTDTRVQRLCPACDDELRRQPQEELEEQQVQTKPLADQITPIFQKQESPEEETELVQAKNEHGVIQRLCPECEEETVQRQPLEENEEEELQTKPEAGQTSRVTSSISSHIQTLRGGGRPLSQTNRRFFEPRFGYDFSDVRIHSNAQAADTAQAIRARAFTLNNNIVFNEGQFRPDTEEGKKVLAHELTHVVQQQKRSFNHAVNQNVGALSNTIQRQPENCPDNREIEPEHPGTCPEITRDPGERQHFEAFGPSMRMVFPFKCYVLENLPINDTAFGAPALFTEIANFLLLHPGATVHLTGFTDCLGAESRNARLRNERAFAVEEYLTRVLGVDPWRVFIKHEPVSNYLVANDLAYDRAQNRAVAIYLELPDEELTDEECALAVGWSLGTAWLSGLPDCPCLEPEDSEDWDESSSTIGCFHPGAASCYRQVSGTHGQQCCYNNDHALITGGAAAGTPDWASSSGSDHQSFDVWTWEVLGWQRYNQFWVPNNDLGCDENIVSAESDCSDYHFWLASRPNPCRVR